MGARYAREILIDPEWERFVRHHTGLAESVEDTRHAAEEAVSGLTERTSRAEREALVIRALNHKRRERAKGVKPPSGRRRRSVWFEVEASY